LRSSEWCWVSRSCWCAALLLPFAAQAGFEVMLSWACVMPAHNSMHARFCWCHVQVLAGADWACCMGGRMCDTAEQLHGTVGARCCRLQPLLIARAFEGSLVTSDNPRTHVHVHAQLPVVTIWAAVNTLQTLHQLQRSRRLQAHISCHPLAEPCAPQVLLHCLQFPELTSAPARVCWHTWTTQWHSQAVDGEGKCHPAAQSNHKQHDLILHAGWHNDTYHSARPPQQVE
jgi:hypothetical protein